MSWLIEFSPKLMNVYNNLHESDQERIELLLAEMNAAMEKQVASITLYRKATDAALRAVCEVLDVYPEEVTSKSIVHHIVVARTVIVGLLSSKIGIKYSELAEKIDHSRHTPRYLYNRHIDLYDKDRQYTEVFNRVAAIYDLKMQETPHAN